MPPVSLCSWLTEQIHQRPCLAPQTVIGSVYVVNAALFPSNTLWEGLCSFLGALKAMGQPGQKFSDILTAALPETCEMRSTGRWEDRTAGKSWLMLQVLGSRGRCPWDCLSLDSWILCLLFSLRRDNTSSGIAWLLSWAPALTPRCPGQSPAAEPH